MNRKRVLFVCTANSARSQLAEALVNHDLGDRFEVFSAGTAPTAPRPEALAVLAELGINHSRARSKSIDEFADQAFDFVITLCDGANETCPLFFGGVRREHLGFPDPARAAGTPEEILDVFRRVRDEIRQTVEGYLLGADIEAPNS
ncbi:MAG: arsenate reductase ArsC [Candidatus Aminicenantes bacterium]|nr:arsenate reductase ArsC [Candidatus Aminicenantes bacterium]